MEKSFKEQNLKKSNKSFNKGNYICWIGCFIAIISLFLPFCSASANVFTYKVASASTTLMSQPDGMVWIVLIIIVAVINLFRFNIVTIILSAITCIFGFIDITSVSSQYKGYAGAISYKFGAGAILLMIGVLIMLVASIGALLLQNNNKKISQQEILNESEG